jgi:hypothetical protein
MPLYFFRYQEITNHKLINHKYTLHIITLLLLL